MVEWKVVISRKKLCVPMARIPEGDPVLPVGSNSLAPVCAVEVVRSNSHAPVYVVEVGRSNSHAPVCVAEVALQNEPGVVGSPIGSIRTMDTPIHPMLPVGIIQKTVAPAIVGPEIQVEV